MFWLKRLKHLPESNSGIRIRFSFSRIIIRILKPLVFLLSLFILTNPSKADGFVFPADFPKELRQQHQQAFTKTEILDAWHSTCLYFLEKADFANTINAGNELKEYAVMFRQPKYEAGAYEVQGMAYEYLGQLAKAVEYHLKSLQIRERLGRKKPIALSLSHMGDVYAQLKSYDKAVDYLTKALKIFKAEGDVNEAAEVENNLGNIMRIQGKYLQALKVFQSSLKGFQKSSNDMGVANAFSAIGSTYMQLNLLDSALVYHNSALMLREGLNLDMEISSSFSDLCLLYLKRRDFAKARFYGERAKEMDKELGILEGLQADYGNLSEVDEGLGNYKSALTLLKLENTVRDSLNNQTAQEEIARQSLGFEIQKQQYRDSLIKAEEFRKIELKRKLDEKAQFRKSTLQYTGIFLFIMALLAVTFLIRRIQLPVIWLEGGIFFTALLLFEFLLLILDPVVELYSGGAPVYKFGMNLVLGLLVFYAHSFFESKMKESLLLGGSNHIVSADALKEESSAGPLHSPPGNQESE
jgi:tetratricopeptide (TPR) repeat protein